MSLLAVSTAGVSLETSLFFWAMYLFSGLMVVLIIFNWNDRS